jgi:sugar (glycoside-pentoside-hexuronide) transporter
METNSQNKIGFKKVLLFGSGDLYGGGAQVVVSFFYLLFLTDIVGLTPALAGTIVLVSRVWDAISDPLMGVISDKTKTRWGRRRPYFLAGFLLIILSYTLLWSTLPLGTQSTKFVFALVTYLFYSTVITLVMVPYSAMSTEVTFDYEERNSVNGTRLFFSQLASLLGALLPLTIVSLFSDVILGYNMMGLLFGIFFGLPFLLIFLFLREKEGLHHDEPFHIKTFIRPYQVKTFRRLIGLYIGAFIAMDVISAVVAYHLRYYYNRPEDITIVLGILLLSVIAALPLIVIYGANKLGKGKTFALGAIVTIFGVIIMALLPREVPGYVIYLVAIVTGFGLAPCTAIPWLMFPDATDAGELKFKMRNAGSFSGVMTFTRKLSSAIGIFLVGLMLEFGGYVAPVTEQIDGVWQTSYFEQPETVFTVFRIIIAVVPTVLLIFGIILALKYPMNKTRHKKLRSHLDALKEEKPSPLSLQEIEELELELL